MTRFIVILGIFCILNVDGLRLEKNRPGALPFLAQQSNNKASGGGISAYNLTNPENYEDLEHVVLLALDYVQGKDIGNFSSPDRKTYKTHKLIQIKEANYQVVSGFNYDVILTVGERNCEISASSNKSANAARPKHGCSIVENGQYGRCYFKLYHQSWTGTLEVTKSICVATDRKDATS